MAFTTLILEDKNKITKEAPVGYSWITLIFGFLFGLAFLVPLYRGDWKYSLIMLVANIVTLGLAGIIVFPFMYNKLYVQNLVKDGFKPKKYCAIYNGIVRVDPKEELLLIRKNGGINTNNLPVILNDKIEKDIVVNKVKSIGRKALDNIVRVIFIGIISILSGFFSGGMIYENFGDVDLVWVTGLFVFVISAILISRIRLFRLK